MTPFVPRTALLLLIAVGLVACGARTPTFRDGAGRPVPGSVADEGPVEVNGTSQWLLARGRDARAPILLVLHGGPGSSETVLFRRYLGAALEDLLVVAYWDQRGAGRSYDPAIPPRTMTVEQFLADTDALVDHLRQRFRQDKVALLGHSWGSALGALYAARHPEKVSAFVGTAQIASMPKGEASAYAATLAEARRRGDARGVSELEEIGPPPHSVAAMWTLRRWTAVYDGEFARPPARWGLVAWALRSGEASLLDPWRLWRGSQFTMNAMWPDVRALEVARTVPRFEMPVAFLLGRHDGVAPPSLAAAWLADLDAPRKRIVWFEHSAHNPPFEEPDAFAGTVLSVLAEAGVVCTR